MTFCYYSHVLKTFIYLTIGLSWSQDTAPIVALGFEVVLNDTLKPNFDSFAWVITSRYQLSCPQLGLIQMITIVTILEIWVWFEAFSVLMTKLVWLPDCWFRACCGVWRVNGAAYTTVSLIASATVCEAPQPRRATVDIRVRLSLKREKHAFTVHII